MSGNLTKITGQYVSFRKKIEDGFYLVCSKCKNSTKLKGSIYEPFKYPVKYMKNDSFGECEKCGTLLPDLVFAIEDSRHMYVIIKMKIRADYVKLENDFPAFYQKFSDKMIGLI